MWAILCKYNWYTEVKTHRFKTCYKKSNNNKLRLRSEFGLRSVTELGATRADFTLHDLQLALQSLNEAEDMIWCTRKPKWLKKKRWESKSVWLLEDRNCSIIRNQNIRQMEGIRRRYVEIDRHSCTWNIEEEAELSEDKKGSKCSDRILESFRWDEK